MYLSGSGKISKSMNGLLRIRATEIDCDVATIDTINGLQNIDAKIGENIIISTDANKNIQFNSDVSMNYDLDVSGNTNLTTLMVNGLSDFNDNMDLTGDLIIRDRTDSSSNYMSVYYDPAYFGFRFKNNRPGGYMYFSVLDPTGTQLRTFQFNHSQLYNNMKFYQDGIFNQGFGQQFYQGDANSDIGSKIWYIPSTNATDGWNFNNRGIPNAGLVFYTNFINSDQYGNETQVLRMKYDNLWSRVKHTFEMDASMNANLSVAGTSTLKQISGTTLNISGTSNFGNTITADSLSVYNNTNLNGNLNAISTSNFIGVSTFLSNLIANANIHASSFDCSNNAVFNGIATFNNALNAGSISCSSITASGNILCSSFRTTGNAQIDGNLNVSSKTAINTIAGISTTFTSPTIVNNTITTNNNFTMNGTTASTNKIIQPRIFGDTTGNPNVLKYTQFRFNSNSASGTQSAGVNIIDDINGASLALIPNSGSGSYNPMCNTNDRSIIAVYGSGQASAVNLLTYGASVKHGIKVFHDTSSNCTSQIYEGNYTFKVNSLTGITASGGVVSSASGELMIVNSASRGMQFLSNSTLSAINPFVGASEAVIATNTQNNSSLVLTTSNSALEYGIRILSNSSTSATITRKVGSNSIITTQVGHTINGPITFATTGVATFSSVPTFNFGFNVGAGNITMNRTDTSYNYITSDDYMVLQGKQTFMISNVSGESNNYWASNHYFENFDASGNTIVNIKGNLNINGTGNKITFPDSTIQTTAYTDTLNTKLNAIGGAVVCTNLTTTTLTTGVATNVGSISLVPGVWVININADIEIVVGATQVGQILACPSISSTAIGATSKLAINHLNGVSQALGNQWTLNSSNIYVPSTTTTYYLIVAANFSVVNRVRFNAQNSAFEAYRIG